jgi:SAM-dependent methyltransferase
MNAPIDTRVRHRCRVCDQDGPAPSFIAHEMMFGSKQPFTYVECPACWCVQIVTIPPDLARHYPPHYYSQRPRQEPTPSSGIKRWLVHRYVAAMTTPRSDLTRSLVRALLPLPHDFQAFGPFLVDAGLTSTSDAILDVGCGSSPHRLVAFRRMGFSHVEGIDPFVPADLDYHGVPVYKRSIDAHAGTFGLVMFHHSLEHVADPVAAVRAAAGLLRRGGRCLVRVPLAGTYFWRKYGTQWVEFDAPRHLHLFSPESLRVLAERCGMKVMSCRYDSEPWEIRCSEGYVEGMALQEQQASEQTVDAAQRKRWQDTTDQLNVLGWAGRACVVLAKP